MCWKILFYDQAPLNKQTKCGFYYMCTFYFQQRQAQGVLTSLKEHPEAWTRVDTILEFSNNQQTKYYALQILENVIKTRWKVLPRAQCEGIYFST